ncbi:MAG: DMT family transporter [Cypionkella sp.]|nr:DMT family transporter [Cypionkella sp.]
MTSVAPTDTPIRPLAAVLWMLGSIASFSIMAIAVRELGDTYDTFEVMTYRSAISMVLVVTGAAALGKLGDIRANRIQRHFFRNVLHFTGQNLWFYAMMTVPLAQVFALEFTSPIWVILLSPLIFGEKHRAAPLGCGTWICWHIDGDAARFFHHECWHFGGDRLWVFLCVHGLDDQIFDTGRNHRVNIVLADSDAACLWTDHCRL